MLAGGTERLSVEAAVYNVNNILHDLFNCTNQPKN